jgi:hypothetical protein
MKAESEFHLYIVHMPHEHYFTWFASKEKWWTLEFP